MSKTEYLDRLNFLLQDISVEEREEALEFYKNYFEEAGDGREEQVIQELGSPEKVAAQIKDGLRGGNSYAGQYTDTGYRDERFQDRRDMPNQYGRRQKGGGGFKVLGIIFLCIFAIPVGLPILCVLFALAVSVLAVIFSLGVTVLALMAVGFIVGIVCIVTGILELTTLPSLGILFCGVGFLGLAAGLLFLLATVWVLGTGLPAVFRGITSLFRGMFQRKRGQRV